MPKELVWLVYELKSFNLKLRKNKKSSKNKKDEDNSQFTNTLSSSHNNTNTEISSKILSKQEIGQHDYASKQITSLIQNSILDMNTNASEIDKTSITQSSTPNNNASQITIHMEISKIPPINDFEIQQPKTNTDHHPTLPNTNYCNDIDDNTSVAKP